MYKPFYLPHFSSRCPSCHFLLRLSVYLYYSSYYTTTTNTTNLLQIPTLYYHPVLLRLFVCDRGFFFFYWRSFNRERSTKRIFCVELQLEKKSCFLKQGEKCEGAWKTSCSDKRGGRDWNNEEQRKLISSSVWPDEMDQSKQEKFTITSFETCELVSILKKDKNEVW